MKEIHGSKCLARFFFKLLIHVAAYSWMLNSRHYEQFSMTTSHSAEHRVVVLGWRVLKDACALRYFSFSSCSCSLLYSYHSTTMNLACLFLIGIGVCYGAASSSPEKVSWRFLLNMSWSSSLSHTKIFQMWRVPNRMIRTFFCLWRCHIVAWKNQFKV